MMLGPILAIIKFLLTFMLFYFQFLNPEITKPLLSTLLYFGFVNLRAVGV
jgi:hypothetical protein